MSGYYSKELMEQYMKEEQENSRKAEKNAAQEKNAMKKLGATVERAASSAQIAFEQTQQNRFEIDALRKSLHRTKIAAVVAIAISVVCAAMVMADELAQLTSMLPS